MLGRMLICDLLNEVKDMSLSEKNPHIFTIATLTGHCLNAYGKNYSVSRLCVLDIYHYTIQAGENFGWARTAIY
jgi:hypothetical protein